MEPLSAAALQALSKNDLIKLVESGILQVMIDPADSTQPESLPDIYNDLAAQPIHLGAAARKYQIPHQTLSRWVARGLIRVMGRAGQKIMVSEGWVKYRVDQYIAAGRGRGRRLFG